MVTGIVIFAALSIVVVAVQCSCFFAYEAKKEEAAAVSAPRVCRETV